MKTSISMTAHANTKEGSKRKSVASKLKAAVDLSMWKKKRYAVWASAIPIALFGYVENAKF